MKIYLIVGSIVLALLSVLAWRIYDAGKEAESAAQWRDSVGAFISRSDDAWTVGMNLETGLNEYRAPARELDRKVTHATATDTGNRFDANSVQRTTERIAAGEAARKRIH